MNKRYHDIPYLNLVKDVLENGVYKHDRTGTGTYSVFGREMRFDLRDGSIPLLTTKKMHTKSIFHELLWYLKGDTNVKYLQDNGVRIWNEWADENGDLGPVYGAQWRKCPRFVVKKERKNNEVLAEISDIDQLGEVIDMIKNSPDSRRMIVDAWNVGQLQDMELPPCHYSFQFWTKPLTADERNDVMLRMANRKNFFPEVECIQERHYFFDNQGIPRRELHCIINQRSCDVGLGVPFNIAQYSILLHMVAIVTNTAPGDLIWRGGDVHIYSNHVDQLKEQIERKPYQSPTLEVHKYPQDINDFEYSDFSVQNYRSHPTIKMKVSV